MAGDCNALSYCVTVYNLLLLDTVLVIKVYYSIFI